MYEDIAHVLGFVRVSHEGLPLRRGAMHVYWVPSMAGCFGVSLRGNRRSCRLVCLSDSTSLKEQVRCSVPIPLSSPE